MNIESRVTISLSQFSTALRIYSLCEYYKIHLSWYCQEIMFLMNRRAGRFVVSPGQDNLEPCLEPRESAHFVRFYSGA